jgi:hypothetical protein
MLWLALGATEVFQSQGASDSASRMLLQGLLDAKTAPAARSWRPRANLLARTHERLGIFPSRCSAPGPCGPIATSRSRAPLYGRHRKLFRAPAETLTFVERAGVRDDCLRRN